jgi:WD40 repeat protein
VLWLGIGTGLVALLLVVTVAAVALSRRPVRPKQMVKQEAPPAPRPLLPLPEVDLPVAPPPVEMKPAPAPLKQKKLPVAPGPALGPFAPAIQPERLPGAGFFSTKEGRIHHLAISADGAKLALSFGQPHVFNTRGGHEMTFLPQEPRGGLVYTPVAFHPDGKRLFYAYGSEFFAVLGDIATGKLEAKFDSPNQQVMSLAVSPDGKRALTGHSHVLAYWDLDTKVMLKKWEKTNYTVVAIAFCPDGKHAFTATLQGAVAYWDLEALVKERENSSPATAELHSMSIAPDGNMVAVAGRRGVSTYELPGFRTTTYQLPDHPDNHIAVALCGKGKMMLTAGKSGLVHLWNLDGLRLLGAWEGHRAPITRIVVDPAERLAYSGDESGVVYQWPIHQAPKGVARGE